MQNKNVALHLQVQRKKAGLLQSDLAHLLAIHPSRMSLFENGRSEPSLSEIAALSLIYGKPIENLLHDIFHDVVGNLISRLRTLPPVEQNCRGTFNRAHTLSQLAIRLETQTKYQDGAV